MSTSAEMVTSVGNSWIICRSKSHAGRIYYFNTLTGEAAWNLSEPEIEKAKKRTSILESQTGFQIDNCPEPMESPQDQLNPMPSTQSNKQQMSSQNVIPSKVYNKQIINNQFPKSPYPYTGQFPTISTLNPIQLNIPVAPTINPAMWNVTPHPIFVTPSTAHQEPVVNNAFKNYDYVPVTNTSLPLSSRFKNLGESYVQSMVSKRKTQYSGNTFRGRKNNYRNRFYNSSRNMDLRHRLLSKRKRSLGNYEVNENEDFAQGHLDVDAGNSHSTDRKTSLILNPCEDDEDDIWLEENSKVQSFKESMDISPLKKLLRVENNFESWYIVFDSNVLLNNINFLKMLLHSDNQCRLMVPQIVMDKIQMATNSRLRTQAHKAAYFILQQVDENVAVIDNEIKEESSNDRDIILNCCTKLTGQGYQVVLLTDDIELHNLEGRGFLVFTIRELKKMLSKNVAQGPRSNSLEDLTLSESRSIKITIPNDVNKIRFDNVEENKHRTPLAYPTESYFEANNIPKENDKKNKVYKNTDDVGVQANSTELEVVHRTNKQILDTPVSNINRDIVSKSIEVPVSTRPSNNNNKLNNAGTKKLNRHKSREKSPSKMANIFQSETVEINIGNAPKENRLSNQENLTGEIPCRSSDSFRTSEGETSRAVHNDSSEKVIEEKLTLKRSNENRNINIENQRAHRTKGYVKEKPLSEIEDKNVMFEVTTSAMEDSLKRKCDEWISRFVQIIEEASTQILQQDPPYILDTMLPPWTIYEATECLKRKFSNDNDIVDAANKLLNVLFELGGLRGKLSINITPNKYMQMYSYGVYLIDALQGLLTYNEDLQIAAESLSKLLNDIQNSHLCPSNRDSFIDAQYENAVDVTQDETSNEKEVTKTANVEKAESPNRSQSKITEVINKSPAKKRRPESTTSSPGSYNLRSHRKKLLQEKEEFSEKVTFIRNIDLESSFFTSLHLKKNMETNKNIEHDANNSLNGQNIIENQNDSGLQSTESTNENFNKIGDTDINAQNSNVINEPKVIRNFTKCAEYENKLKNKIEEQIFTYDSWTHKNERYRHETESEENEQMDYTYLENQYYYDDYEYESFDTDEIDEVDEVGDIEESVNSAAEEPKVNFKDIIKNITYNIREAFSSIHIFCDKCYTTLNSGNHFDKKGMQNLAEETRSYLNNICDSLNSILNREASDSANKLQELLNIEELRDITIEDEDIEGYRNFISKCLEQGKILKDSVQLVIEAIRE